jgi:energy-coupling factor transport system ATP-binding protein
MNEAAYGDRVIVIDEGKIVKDGTPAEVFSNVDEIKRLGLDVPQVTELINELKNEGFDLPLDIIDVDKAAEVIKRLF